MEINTLVLDQTKKVIKQALINFATEAKGNEVTPQQVKIIIGTKCLNPNFNEGAGITDDNQQFDTNFTEPYYRVLKNNEPYMRVRKNKNLPNGQEMTDEVTFNQILHVNADLFGRGFLAAKFLSKAIKRFADELNVDPRYVEIGLYTPDVVFDEMGKPMVDKHGKAVIEPKAILYDLSVDEGQDTYVRELDWLNDIFIKDDELEQEITNQ
jgi:hypothetical protein